MKNIEGGIAFFDSGIGGLTVLLECQKKLNTRFYYYGDNLRAPYGGLTKEKIHGYVLEAFDEFAGLKVDAAVIACNTVTALCIDELRQKYSFPIVGTEPAIAEGAKRGGTIFVLTTRATYHSPRFFELYKKTAIAYPNSNIQLYPCDQLAGVIEKNKGDLHFDYSKYLPRGNPTSVVLGCTHYIYIKKQIESFYGCKCIDGNKGIATRLASILGVQGGTGKSEISFLGSGKIINKNKYEQMFLSVEAKNTL